MKIWELDSDRNGYETITLKNKDYLLKYFLDYDGRTITEWTEIHFIQARKGKRSDILYFTSTIPVLSEKAFSALHEFLADQQILPVFYNQKQYHILNITRIIDCIDYYYAEPDRLSAGRITGFKKYAFKFDRLQGIHIFKIPELSRTRIFVSDVFRNRVLENNLHGFRIIEAWDSEDDGSTQRADEESLKLHLQRVEEEKGEEFSYIPAMYMVNEGKAIVSGRNKLQKDRNGNIMLGTLQSDGTYTWIDPYAYPPIFHDWKWHVVDRHYI